MSDDIDVVRAYCRAWTRGDAAAITALYHDELTLIWPGRHRLAGRHTGRDAALAALLELQSITNRVPVEIVDVLAGERSVIAIAIERWSGEGEVVDVRRALEYTIADGKLRTCRVYEADQPTVDAWIGSATAV